MDRSANHDTVVGIGQVFGLPGPSLEPMSEDDLLVEIYRLLPGDGKGAERLLPYLVDFGDLQRETLVNKIAQQTHLPLASLKRAFTRIVKQVQKTDDLALAERVLERWGSENVFHSDEGLYGWSQDGLWQALSKQAFLSRVQAELAATGCQVNTKTVNDVATSLKNRLYEPGERIAQCELDLVNCTNGEVVLQDGKFTLRPHCRESYLTTQIPVHYDPDAEAPRFQAFLDEVFGLDTDGTLKMRALLECMGYTLMQHCRHEIFCILLGDGANGKSVVLNVLAALVGQHNASAVPMNQFDRAFVRAQLQHKLANIVTEIGHGEVLADAAVKGIVSGEPTTVEHKFQPPFVMRPYATLWMATNHMPHTKDFSPAIFRRGLILKFNRTFSLSEQDKTLMAKLQHELPGILNLALQAYASAVEHGFTKPVSSEAAKDEWRKEADQVAAFVDESCIVDPEAVTSVRQLYTAYSGWANSSGHSRPVNIKTFSQRLQRLGFASRRTNEARTIVGLKIAVQEVGH
jgi:putative DNA primase/helicase